MGWLIGWFNIATYIRCSIGKLRNRNRDAIQSMVAGNTPTQVTFLTHQTIVIDTLNKKTSN
ncbi:hypothetical protein B5D82_14895 [Cognaticolwellia beringensis]|uniref:Uncharacterized protein n=1 Tax=Cognaticolwellia beringensis TaxID=1967665 RepID=A0A222GB74_9GAMM|nr:hypothetical protein B5D82_14895 [Cognaticolwellia beringensis]